MSLVGKMESGGRWNSRLVPFFLRREDSPNCMERNVPFFFLGALPNKLPWFKLPKWRNSHLCHGRTAFYLALAWKTKDLLPKGLSPNRLRMHLPMLWQAQLGPEASRAHPISSFTRRSISYLGMSQINPRGNRRFSPMFPFTRVLYWVPFLDAHPFQGLGSKPTRDVCDR